MAQWQQRLVVLIKRRTIKSTFRTKLNFCMFHPKVSSLKSGNQLFYHDKRKNSTKCEKGGTEQKKWS